MRILPICLRIAPPIGVAGNKPRPGTKGMGGLSTVRSPVALISMTGLPRTGKALSRSFGSNALHASSRLIKRAMRWSMDSVASRCNRLPHHACSPWSEIIGRSRISCTIAAMALEAKMRVKLALGRFPVCSLSSIARS